MPIKWIINALMVFLLLPATYAADDFTQFKNAFTTPVQTWMRAEHGTLQLDGNTRIYGFNAQDHDVDDKVNVKIKSIIDNAQWKNFCHVGYQENNPPGYQCKTDKISNIININTIPKFDLSFADVENINIANSSKKNATFNNQTGGTLKLPPGNYDSVTINGKGVVTLPSGDFKINHLVLDESIQVIFPNGSKFQINQISTRVWGEGSNMSLTSYADSLVVKDATFSNAGFYLKNGVNRIERLTVTNNAIYEINQSATMLLHELNISNGAQVAFYGERNKTNFKAKRYNLTGGASTVSFAPGYYYIYYYNNGSTDNKTLYNGEVTIVANQVQLSGSGKIEKQRVNIFALDDATGAAAKFAVDGSANLCANAFSRRTLTVSGEAAFSGAVIADQIILQGSGSIRYYPGSACKADEVNHNNYQLQLAPTLDYSLLCQTQQLKFQVVDSNNQPTGSFTGTIDITPSNVNLTPVSGRGSGSDGRYTPNSAGELWLELRVPQGSGGQTLTISGTLNPQGSSNSVTGTYHFVPYKFATEEQYVIANKPQKVEVKVLACNDDGDVVDVNYSGTPQVSSAWVAPTSDVAQGDLTFTPVFTQGVANSELTMEDSGHKTVALEDGSFDCSELGDDCPIEGNTTLKGSFEVYSRPWTFVICSTENTDLDRATGTSSSGEGFLAAGQMFDAQIIPIKYQEKGLTAGEILSTSELCKEAKFTSNFFIENTSNEQTDKLVQLSSMVASPDAPLSSDLLMSSDDGGLSKDRVNSNKKYLFSNLFWSDVGSLKVMAAMAGYDDECKKPSGLAQWYNCTQIGYRNIGRFYPAYFKLTESKWWIDDQNNIAYLSQPYNKAQFVIVPYALDGGRVKNYADFGSEVIAQIDGLDDEKYPSRLLVDIASGKWLKDADDTTQWSVILGKEYKNAAVFNRKYQLTESGSDKLTVEGKQFSMVDGPFNIPSQSLIFDEQSTRTHFGLTVEGVDPVEARVNIEQRKPEIECINYVDEQQLNSCQLTFPVQPPARYGRMVMDDVGGTSVSKIAIPLRVEYWQGSRFTTNHADSGSVYATLDNYICKQTLWPSPSSPSNAKLSGSDTEPWTKVSQGQSKQLVAEPHATEDTQGLREQIRFWLRLDNDQTNLEDNKRSPQVGEEGVNCGTQYTSQPWLQYNWFARGDEDPSAVVTFGIHRGNDKIIFRGETRLSGQ